MPSPKADFLIHKERDAYYLDDKIVDANLVAALVRALRAPVNPQPSLDDLGITPAWLKANASSVTQKMSGSLINGAPIHVAALESTFADPVTMDKIALGLFKGWHTDDYPSVKVLVTFEDGTSTSATTGSQYPFLLPWELDDQGHREKAYNADISRAVAALMPEKSTNRSRLAGENRDVQLARVAMMQIEHQQQMLDVEKQTGNTFSALRSRYTIESAHVDDYGEPAASKAEPKESNLRLLLTASDLLPHFRDEVILPYMNGNIVGTDSFPRDAPRFEKLALSVPSLNQYLQEHKVPIRISFVQGVSFSDSAFRLFSADMQAIGRSELIPKVAAMKDRLALIFVWAGADESDWLVFPDEHMLLWQYGKIPNATDFLKWSVSDFPRKPCSERWSIFGGCVGREVSANGV